MRAALALVLLSACASADTGPHDRTIGMPCATNGDCVVGTLCAVVELDEGAEVRECIATCGEETAYRCEGTALCYPSGYAGDGPEGMIWGCFPPGRVRIGQPCTFPTSCEAGLACEHEVSRETGTCTPYCPFHACEEGDWCQTDEQCSLGVLGCALSHETPSGWAGRCVPRCGEGVPPLLPSLCDRGELCWEGSVGSSSRVCLRAGPFGVGTTCEYHFECGRGLFCAQRGGAFVCVEACNTTADCGVGTCRAGLCE